MEDDLKTCPDCAENVKSAAKVCRFCGHDFMIFEKEKLKLKTKKDFKEKIREKQKSNFSKYFTITNQLDEFYYNVFGCMFLRQLDVKSGMYYYYGDYSHLTSTLSIRYGDIFYSDLFDTMDLGCEFSDEQNIWFDEVFEEWSLKADLEAVANLGFRIDPASFKGDDKKFVQILETYPDVKLLMDDLHSQEFSLRWNKGRFDRENPKEENRITVPKKNNMTLNLNVPLSVIIAIIILGIGFCSYHNSKSSTLGDYCAQYSDPNDQLRCLGNGAARANDAERRRLNGL